LSVAFDLAQQAALEEGASQPGQRVEFGEFGGLAGVHGGVTWPR
jgi:hypothetical protein